VHHTQEGMKMGRAWSVENQGLGGTDLGEEDSVWLDKKARGGGVGAVETLGKKGAEKNLRKLHINLCKKTMKRFKKEQTGDRTGQS